MHSIFMNTNNNRLDYNFLKYNIVFHKIMCFKGIVFYCKIIFIVWTTLLLLEGPEENIWDYYERVSMEVQICLTWLKCCVF